MLAEIGNSRWLSYKPEVLIHDRLAAAILDFPIPVTTFGNETVVIVLLKSENMG